jgi:uridine kinase
MKPVVIGIAGPSGSGKTELASRLQGRLPDATMLSLDCYYLDQSGLPLSARERLNFDDPAMLDWDLIVDQIGQLAAGFPIDQPVYSFATHTRRAETERVEPARHILVEGIFALHDARLRSLYDVAIFVDAPDEVCLDRRIERDVLTRGRTRESVVRQFEETVRPGAERHIRPKGRLADLQVSGVQPITHSVEAALERITRH